MFYKKLAQQYLTDQIFKKFMIIVALGPNDAKWK